MDYYVTNLLKFHGLSYFTCPINLIFQYMLVNLMATMETGDI